MPLLGLLAYNEGRKASLLSIEAAKQEADRSPEPIARPLSKKNSDKQPEDVTVPHDKRQTFHPRRLRPQLAEKRTFTDTILNGPHLRSAPARHDARPVSEAYILGFKLEALRQADLAGRERLVPSTEPSLFDTNREAFYASLQTASRASRRSRLPSPDRYTRYSRWSRQQRKD